MACFGSTSGKHVIVTTFSRNPGKDFNYPYKSFMYDKFEGRRKWAVYVLYPREATIGELRLPWFDNAPLPWQEVAFSRMPLHLLVKLLQIRLFRGDETSRFIGQENVMCMQELVWKIFIIE
jgi:hypothetical protein